MSEENVIAPEGSIWVCIACGKYAKDKFGNERGWDAGCMLNSSLFKICDLEFENGRVKAVKKKENKNIILGDIL